MNNALRFLILLLLICGEAHAQDEFQVVKCGTNIATALLGKHLSSESVVVIEGRHKDLSLKDLGGTEVSDTLFLSSWLICGSEFMMLVDTSHHGAVVRDVLQFPSHSKSSPEFMGSCRLNNQEIPEMIVAVLDNGEGYKVNAPDPRALLSARSAWKIDEGNKRFIQIASGGLRCSVNGIISEDSIY